MRSSHSISVRAPTPTRLALCAIRPPWAFRCSPSRTSRPPRVCKAPFLQTLGSSSTELFLTDLMSKVERRAISSPAPSHRITDLSRRSRPRRSSPKPDNLDVSSELQSLARQIAQALPFDKVHSATCVKYAWASSATRTATGSFLESRAENTLAPTLQRSLVFYKAKCPRLFSASYAGHGNRLFSLPSSYRLPPWLRDLECPLSDPRTACIPARRLDAFEPDRCVRCLLRGVLGSQVGGCRQTVAGRRDERSLGLLM